MQNYSRCNPPLALTIVTGHWLGKDENKQPGPYPNSPHCMRWSISMNTLMGSGSSQSILL